MRRRWLIGAGLVAALAVAAVAVAAQPSPVMSRTRLERARGLLAAEQARHFTAEIVLTGTNPEGGRLDARVTGQGDLRARQAHSSWQEPGGLYEEVLLGEQLYSRWASDQDTLEQARWRAQAVGHDQDTGRSLGARALFETGAGAPDLALGSPANLARLLGQVDLEAGSGKTISGTLPFDQLFPDGQVRGQDGAVSVQLTAAEDGALERMVWKVSGHVPSAPQGFLAGDYSLTTTVNFSASKPSLAIQAPAADQVDHPGQPAPHQFDYDPTSVVAETAFPALAPTELPAGFRLVGASVVPGDDHRCTKVALHWEDPVLWAAWLDTDHLQPSPNDFDIRQYSAACLGNIAAPGQPFQAGAYKGTIALPYEEYDFSTVYLTVGATHLVIKSDLPVEQVRVAVASLKRFDPATQPLIK